MEGLASSADGASERKSVSCVMSENKAARLVRRQNTARSVRWPTKPEQFVGPGGRRREWSQCRRSGPPASQSKLGDFGLVDALAAGVLLATLRRLCLAL